MRIVKTLTLFVTFLLFSNPIQSQVEAFLYILGGLRGVSGNNTIQPCIRSLKITDINSLKGVSKINPEKPLMLYKGLTVYNQTTSTKRGVNLSEGLYTWNGAKWTTTYAEIPRGSLKEDLQALYNLTQLTENKRVKNWHGWNIDLENINNPNNLKLRGVFFRKINGEYRVEELRLDYSSFENLTLTKGLEALVYLTFKNSNCKKLNTTLPNLIYIEYNENRSLVEANLACPRLTYALFSNNSKLETVFLDCPKLDKLSCPLNHSIKALNPSKSIDLTELNCSFNKLATLDVSKNINLNDLDCSGNQLTTLDVLDNTQLIALNCRVCKLTTLDVSKNTELILLECSYNELTKLNISKNIKLTNLRCQGCKLSTLDVSKNTLLKHLQCSENQLINLDLTNNTALNEIWVWINQLSTLNLSKNTLLCRLNCSNNKLTTLDVSNNTKLIQLECDKNQLTSLDLSRNKELTNLSYYGNPLTKAPIRHN